MGGTFPDVDHQGTWDRRDIDPVADKGLDLKATVGGNLEKLGTSGPSTESKKKAYENEETRIVMRPETHCIAIFNLGVMNNYAAVLDVFGMLEEFVECVWGKTERFCEKGDKSVGQVGELLEVFFCYFTEARD